MAQALALARKHRMEGGRAEVLAELGALLVGTNHDEWYPLSVNLLQLRCQLQSGVPSILESPLVWSTMGDLRVVWTDTLSSITFSPGAMRCAS